jgi:hypothetical protein
MMRLTQIPIFGNAANHVEDEGKLKALEKKLKYQSEKYE